MKEFLIGWVVAEEELADFCRNFNSNCKFFDNDEDCIEYVGEYDATSLEDYGSWYYVDSACGLYLIGWNIEELYDIHLDDAAEFYADYGLPLNERSYNVVMCEHREGQVAYKDIVDACKFITLFED